MPYLTQAKLESRLPGDELHIFASDGEGGLDAAKIAEAIQDASDEIDSYVAQAYRLPLPTVPRILERVCTDLTIYYLARGPAMSEEMDDRYTRHVKWLKLVASKDVSLGLPIEHTPDAAQSSFHGEGRNDFKNWSP